MNRTEAEASPPTRFNRIKAALALVRLGLSASALSNVLVADDALAEEARAPTTLTGERGHLTRREMDALVIYFRWREKLKVNIQISCDRKHAPLDTDFCFFRRSFNPLWLALLCRPRLSSVSCVATNTYHCLFYRLTPSHGYPCCC